MPKVQSPHRQMLVRSWIFFVVTFCLSLVLLPYTIVAANAASVTVEVLQVRDSRGHVLVALCTRQTFLTASCPYRASVSAAPGRVSLRIDGVEPGLYAVEAFQDDNDTGTIERSFFGLPTKGIGFSRDAPMRFGPPRFADAAFSVGQERTVPPATTIVTLHYYN